MIGAIVLAAGRSRRFGGDKRRHVLPSGLSMLATTTRLFQQAFTAIRIVVSPRDGDLLTSLGINLRPRDELIVAADADLGMGRSLAAGATDLHWDQTFVGLADMPYLKAETLQALIARARLMSPEDVLVPIFKGQRGHPVCFGATHLPALSHLTGDQGARAILGTKQSILIDVNDEGILLDVDQPPPSRVAQSSLDRHDP